MNAVAPTALPGLSPIERLGSPPLTRADVAEIVDVWKARLRLDHWQVTISDEQPEVDTDLGSIAVHGPYDYAELRLNAGYAAWTRWDANLVVVHELMHLHTRDLEYACDLEDVLGTQAHTLYKARFGHELEALVDKTATLLVNAWSAA